MSKATSHLFTAAQSRAIDQRAISELPVSGFTLMQRAAEFACNCMLQQYPGIAGISVWCGKGNNAGDAYLLACLAQHRGLRVQLVAVEPPEQLRDDALLAWQRCQQLGLTMVRPTDADFLVQAELVVDGLLGTGFSGEPRGNMAQALTRLQQLEQPIMSLDVPSGVNASSGAAAATAVRADVTVSFITQKVGLFTGAGVDHVGRLMFSDLAVPDYLYREGIALRYFSRELLAPLARSSHKHQRGHVAVVGGDLSMPGAVIMAAQAAMRAGAGMVTVVTHASHTNAIVSRIPEVMVLDAHSNLSADLLAKADLVVAGPGLGRSEWSQQVFQQVEDCVSRNPQKAVLLDADGLYWLAGKGAWPGQQLYITPHVAEAATLLDWQIDQVQADRRAAAEALQQQFHCLGVLKGAGSIIFGPDHISICAHGNPGMATAGMGDVLSGVVGGLLAGYARSGLSDEDADQLLNAFAQAVALHSAAGDQAAARLGMRSLLATDVVDSLPALLQGEMT